MVVLKVSKGIGTRAVQLATEYSATVLGLGPLGPATDQIRSFNLFMKLGWTYWRIPDYWIDNNGATQQEHLFHLDQLVILLFNHNLSIYLLVQATYFQNMPNTLPHIPAMFP